MVGGCTDSSTILEQYPNTAKFMEKPKSKELPTNFNTFYGPRILEQLPHVIKELKEKRYSICKSCEYFDKNSKNCKKCSCFMPMKTLFVVATCPLEKW